MIGWVEGIQHLARICPEPGSDSSRADTLNPNRPENAEQGAGAGIHTPTTPHIEPASNAPGDTRGRRPSSVTKSDYFLGRPAVATPDSISFQSDPTHDAIPRRPPYDRSDPKQSRDHERSDRPNLVCSMGPALLKGRDVPDLIVFDSPAVPSDPVPTPEPFPDKSDPVSHLSNLLFRYLPLETFGPAPPE